MRLDLAQYRELAAFAQFGSELDKSTQQQLNRGARLVEILKQPQYQPLPMEKMVSILYAGTRGFLDKYPIDVLASYEQQLYSFMESKYADLLADIKEKKEFTPEIDAKMKAILEEFDAVFQPVVERRHNERGDKHGDPTRYQTQNRGGQEDPADHQGHEHGLGRETAGRPAAHGRVPALCRGLRHDAGQYGRPGRTGDPSLLPSGRRR